VALSLAQAKVALALAQAKMALALAHAKVALALAQAKVPAGCVLFSPIVYYERRLCILLAGCVRASRLCFALTGCGL